MEPHVLLARLRALLSRAPDLDAYTPGSQPHQQWLGQAHALLGHWNRVEAASFQGAANFLTMNRNYNIGMIFGSLHRAVADLELGLPENAGQAFGPGAIYDFFRALNGILRAAEASVLVVDPYMDDSIFDTYLSGVPNGVAVRLLLYQYSDNVKPAAEKFMAQHGTALEARKSSSLHDRLIFVDGSVCWVLGHSIKDAAANKPTYLAPLSPDVAELKLAFYEPLWNDAAAI